MSNRYLLWDFDGTLAYREGMWSGAVRDAIVQYLPNSSITTEAIRPFLSSGFPWHTPEVEHCHITSGDAWWLELRPVFARMLAALSIDKVTASVIADAVKGQYLNLEAWRVCEGAVDVVMALKCAGWRHVIVSNHVPELRELVSGLGFAPYFEQVFCSAELGVEKPHPAIFARVLASLGNQPSAWVIGDSVRADIAGARAAGLRSILVGACHPSANRCVSSLRDVPHALAAAEADAAEAARHPSRSETRVVGVRRH